MLSTRTGRPYAAAAAWLAARTPKDSIACLYSRSCFSCGSSHNQLAAAAIAVMFSWIWIWVWVWGRGGGRDSHWQAKACESDVRCTSDRLQSLQPGVTRSVSRRRRSGLSIQTHFGAAPGGASATEPASGGCGGPTRTGISQLRRKTNGHRVSARPALQRQLDQPGRIVIWSGATGFYCCRPLQQLQFRLAVKDSEGITHPRLRSCGNVATSVSNVDAAMAAATAEPSCAARRGGGTSAKPLQARIGVQTESDVS